MAQDSYRFHVGSIRCTVFASAREPLTRSFVESIFTQDVERMVAQWDKLLAPQEFCQNILYLETGDKRVLIDTGEGENVPEKPGQLLNLLHAEGIAPESIDTIILTHFHIDHLGGLLDADGKLNFPKARVVTSRTEYDFVMREEFLATLKGGRAGILRQTFAAYPPEFAEAGEEVEPGITLVAAPGHTPDTAPCWSNHRGNRCSTSSMPPT